MLKATFRERRGVVTLHGVPPAVGFALLDYYAWPRAGTNRGGAVYTVDHPSYNQGTSAGKSYHFIKFAYDNMLDAAWAFPLDNYYPKTCVGPVRLVTNGRFNDLRVFGTPVQFKYKWAVQKEAGQAVMGVHTFTVTANIGHIGLHDGTPRFNTEYGRWVAEQQLEHITAVKSAIERFPVRPFRTTHKMAGVVHPLADWANAPTPMPVLAAVPVDAMAYLDDDDYNDDDVDDISSQGSDGDGDGEGVLEEDSWEGNTSDECPCVGCDVAAGSATCS